MALPTDFSRVAGNCVYCGEIADPQLEYTSELTCSFNGCGRQIYHQECVDTHLRKIKHNPGQMSGFKCPRGHGKAFCDNPCGGRIKSTHRFQPCNQKKKNKAVQAAAAKPVVAQAPVAKPVAKAAAPAPAAGKKAPAVKQAVLKDRDLPVPVKPIHRSKLNGPAATSMTNDQLRDAVALVRKQLNTGKTFDGSNGAAGPVAPAAARSKLSPATSLTIPKLNPITVAAPVFKLQAAPRNDVAPPPVRAVMQPARTNPTINLNFEAFPALDAAAAVPVPVPVQQTPTPEWSRAPKAPKAAVNAVNAAQKSWVTDLGRYNALLGLTADGDEDDKDEYGAFTTHESYLGGDVSSVGGDGSQSPAYTTAASEMPELTEELLAYAIQYGVEAAGLPPEYHDYVAQVIAAYGLDRADFEALFAEGADDQVDGGLYYSQQELTPEGSSSVYETAYEWQTQDQSDEYAAVYQAAIDVAYAVQQQQQTDCTSSPQNGVVVTNLMQPAQSTPEQYPGAEKAGDDDDEIDVNDLMALCIG